MDNTTGGSFYRKIVDFIQNVDITIQATPSFCLDLNWIELEAGANNCTKCAYISERGYNGFDRDMYQRCPENLGGPWIN